MKNVYDQVPTFENEKYMLRFVQIDDAKELLEVYSDKNALPFLIVTTVMVIIFIMKI